MKTLVLYRTMFKQTIIGLRRYLFETITGTATLFLFFLALYFGANALGAGSPKFRGAPEAIIVSYLVWSLAIFSYFSMAQDLVQEAQLGTLEQLAMSPLGLGKVLFGRVLAGLVWQFITITVMLFLMMVTTGKWLHLNVVAILPIALLTLGGIVGLSFLMGGLAIVFKRVQSALQIMQIAFIALVALPINRFGFIKFMPLAWGNALLKKVMIANKGLSVIPIQDLGFLLFHAVAYVLLGLAAFKYFERVARRRGLLGHY